MTNEEYTSKGESASVKSVLDGYSSPSAQYFLFIFFHFTPKGRNLISVDISDYLPPSRREVGRRRPNLAGKPASKKAYPEANEIPNRGQRSDDKFVHATTEILQNLLIIHSSNSLHTRLFPHFFSRATTSCTKRSTCGEGKQPARFPSINAAA